MVIDQENCLKVEGIDGHAADVMRAIGMWPDRDDDELSEVEVGRCAD